MKMKFRSLMCVGALVAAVSAADIAGNNVCGLMNVPSTSEYTMIAVPWVNVADGEAVQVAKLVKTDTLTVGDQLYFYDGSKYYLWVLTDGTWTPTETTNKEGTFQSPGAEYGLARGKALTLVRQNTSAEIWLYGQYDDSAISVTCESGAYTMIANPNADAFDLNTNRPGNVGDQITFAGTATLYTRDAGGWYTHTTEKVTLGGKSQTVKTKTYENVTIPAGQGAWYYCKGATVTINW